MLSTKAITLFAVTLVVGGCYRSTDHADSKGASATATAEASSDGTIVTRAPTEEEMDSLNDHSAKREAVDQRFPPPPIPIHAPRVKATRMLATGDLLLEDGRTIFLDGIACTNQGVEYLGRIFIDPAASLIVVESGAGVDGRIPAEVWTVEKFDGGMEMYSFPAETGLTSGWCDPKRSPSSRRNERFAALAEAFANERKAYAGSAP